jgi:Zn-dependent protease
MPHHEARTLTTGGKRCYPKRRNPEGILRENHTVLLSYRTLEGCLIAALWFVVTTRSATGKRKGIEGILLLLLVGAVIFDLKLYQSGVADIIMLMLLAPLVLFTVMTHEISHGWVALQLGDPTAKNQGRLTFNPLKHMSFRWTVLFPITSLYLFKVALIMPKPVPINPRNFENPKKGIMWVGLAGPAVNIFLMLFFALVLGSGIVPASGSVGMFVRLLLTVLIIANMVLALFNLLPIPPLDGSRLLIGLLPVKQAAFLLRVQRL